jgi:hypothetical protein
MRDALGSKIEPGMLLAWMEHKLVYRVMAVDDGGLQIGPGKKDIAPPVLVLQLALPVVWDRNQGEPRLSDMVLAVNPRGQAMVEDILGTADDGAGKPQ